MGTIVCKSCLSTIDDFEDEKVTVLYSDCGCNEEEELDD
ncbi:GapA-binding peptide SR1P [Bacillus smithii]|nr:GapA-binding peptide SR1P [Bacillus smithii]